MSTEELRIRALIDEVFETIRSPVAKELRNLCVAGSKAEALCILRDEQIPEEDLEAVYACCVKQWTGVDVALVEIPMADALTVIPELHRATRAAGKPEPRFVVRHGLTVLSGFVIPHRRTVLSAQPETPPRGLAFYSPDSGFKPLSEIHQLWHVKPRAD